MSDQRIVTQGNYMSYGPDGERIAAFATEADRTTFEAAPDLLAALRQLMEWEGFDGGFPGSGHDEDTDRRQQEVWQDAQDAIDKATGNSRACLVGGSKTKEEQ
jgi:hypothetical protein